MIDNQPFGIENKKVEYDCLIRYNGNQDQLIEQKKKKNYVLSILENTFEYILIKIDSIYILILLLNI